MHDACAASHTAGGASCTTVATVATGVSTKTLVTPSARAGSGHSMDAVTMDPTTAGSRTRSPVGTHTHSAASATAAPSGAASTLRPANTTRQHDTGRVDSSEATTPASQPSVANTVPLAIDHADTPACIRNPVNDSPLAGLPALPSYTAAVHDTWCAASSYACDGGATPTPTHATDAFTAASTPGATGADSTPPPAASHRAASVGNASRHDGYAGDNRPSSSRQYANMVAVSSLPPVSPTLSNTGVASGALAFSSTRAVVVPTRPPISPPLAATPSLTAHPLALLLLPSSDALPAVALDTSTQHDPDPTPVTTSAGAPAHVARVPAWRPDGSSTVPATGGAVCHDTVSGDVYDTLRSVTVARPVAAVTFTVTSGYPGVSADTTGASHATMAAVNTVNPPHGTPPSVTVGASLPPASPVALIVTRLPGVASAGTTLNTRGRTTTATAAVTLPFAPPPGTCHAAGSATDSAVGGAALTCASTTAPGHTHTSVA